MFNDYLPKKESVTKQHAWWIGKKIHDHNLWSYNIQSVPRGVAVGLFLAFIPLPVQMLLAVIFGSLLRANLPLAVACTWITNPITFIPINYLIHDFGEWILNMQHQKIIISPLHFQKEWRTFFEEISNLAHALGKPFLVALPIVALSTAIISYVFLTVAWLIVIKMRNILSYKKAK